MRRRWRVGGVVLLVLVLGATLAGAVRSRPPHGPPAPQYTDLEAALAPEVAHGWVLAIPPKRPGPYRLLPGGPMLGSTPGAVLECCIRDAAGAVVEEIKLTGAADCDQGVVYLETADGRQTMAALKRPSSPAEPPFVLSHLNKSSEGGCV